MAAARGAIERTARMGSARSPSCSATRAGGGTRSSACCWPSPAWSGSGGSASSASTCSDPSSTRLPSTGAIGPRASPASRRCWTGITSLLQNAGGFFGIYAFTHVTAQIGRKPAFAHLVRRWRCSSTAFTFWNLNDFSEIFWMIPLMGFCQLALFGGYAIYFPELFPTRLRSTGTSFCYNVGRFVAAARTARARVC